MGEGELTFLHIAKKPSLKTKKKMRANIYKHQKKQLALQIHETCYHYSVGY